ncbi:unnamed protein product [Trichogramma brassicae]|uniref:Uncharacterized protein n=1 Tax=Trichogramma brassicae TaxID=86971 RepID=A0A6H5IWD0_9HYME|nr:unnamed protein product [Trichogramma brassicae]
MKIACKFLVLSFITRKHSSLNALRSQQFLVSGLLTDGFDFYPHRRLNAHYTPCILSEHTSPYMRASTEQRITMRAHDTRAASRSKSTCHVHTHACIRTRYMERRSERGQRRGDDTAALHLRSPSGRRLDGHVL